MTFNAEFISKAFFVQKIENIFIAMPTVQTVLIRITPLFMVRFCITGIMCVPSNIRTKNIGKIRCAVVLSKNNKNLAWKLIL